MYFRKFVTITKKNDVKEINKIENIYIARINKFSKTQKKKARIDYYILLQR